MAPETHPLHRAGSAFRCVGTGSSETMSLMAAAAGGCSGGCQRGAARDPRDGSWAGDPGPCRRDRGRVRRRPEAGNKDKGKGSYLWDSVRFAHKTFCVEHALKTIDADMILWLDADTYTFRPMPIGFLENFG
mgnify:CR=1 FL=1